MLESQQKSDDSGLFPHDLSGLFEECSLKKLALTEENDSGSCIAMKTE